ncbi:LTA synthase family protein [Desulforhopalus singaporensis]|uniref:Phosphoglycerol transferase MdoB n=1 Tax=Desulforhopalus singaporensis TaxID=91360 RepID=A0A1H0LUA9_9BACT|nr:LTA synthase family protein [Desulforhopalus singaporensis]SDO71693.1 Phosphoglycerol transferase MdoB [Desulforhopalus singaporensis]
MNIRKAFIYYRDFNTPAPHSICWRRTLLALLAMLAWAAALYAVLQWGIFVFFSIQVWPTTWVKDAAAHIVVGLVLYLVARSWKMWAAAFALITAVLQVSNGLKLTVLGSPVMPDDFLGFTNMLHLFSDWRLAAMIAAVALPVTVLAASIAWKRKSTWIALGSLVILLAAVFANAPEVIAFMDKRYGDWVWNQPGNYRDRGLVRHLVHEGVRSMARGKVDVSADDVHDAMLALDPENRRLAEACAPARRPNLYMILLESFWDPMVLEHAGIHPDPVDPRFRKLWEDAGHSTTMAPVFGGYTANSEFEALCGFPVTDNGVFFEGWLRNDAPCLPRYLDGAGYQSIAAHPNYAAFWNRVNSYRRIGFDRYWSKNDFVLDDMNRQFLSDASLYRQVWEKLQEMPESGPKFVYIVTFFGHLDYPLSKSRPEVIEVGMDNRMLKGYVNQVYYKSRELMDFVEKIRLEDPDGVIVFFGDHLPYLGANHEGYVQENIFPRNRADFDAEMFKSYVTTPLVIVDGRRGPVDTGTLPMYQLPARLLGLIGDENHGYLHLAQSSKLRYIRPLSGLSLYAPEAGKPVLCKQQTENQDERCPGILRLTRELTVLRQDLFTADQYSVGLQAGQRSFQ